MRSEQTTIKARCVWEGMDGLQRFTALCECVSSYPEEIKSGNHRGRNAGAAYTSKQVQNANI